MSSKILKSISSIINDIIENLNSNEEFFDNFVNIYDDLFEINKKLTVDAIRESQSGDFSNSDLIKAEINHNAKIVEDQNLETDPQESLDLNVLMDEYDDAAILNV